MAKRWLKRRTAWRWLLAALVLVLGIMAVAYAQEEPPPSLETAAESLTDAAVNVTTGVFESLDAFLARITTAPQSDIARLLLVIGGVVLLVVGWRIYNFIILIAGFLIGASIAASLVAGENTVIVFVALIIGGLVGAALGALFYLGAVFLIGAYVGIAFTNAFATAFGLAPVSAVLLLIMAVVGGLILVGLSFELLVVVAAVVGGQMLALGLGLDAVWALVFAAIGVVVQVVLMRTRGVSLRRRYRPRSLWARL